MRNSIEDLQILKAFKVNCRPLITLAISEDRWVLPSINQVKIACDGSSLGNPRPAGAAFVAKNSDGDVIAASCVGLGPCFNFTAEVMAILLGLKLGYENGHRFLWIVSNSIAAISLFLKGKIPWFTRALWKKCG
ncbi:Ribonuclease H domain [Macleaya cordata]|uniref:Ribonuclease H domain n=1 Tax=Macleaya cordata TaxID=56857 RepID=A0A200QNE4_MACCD|nr:Ribonuclease H domain [Macleaya cordata]